MQKIVIKNFGPIRDAEIEIKPFTVLLGEQATGKSTVAQLVHLSRLFVKDFYREIFQNRQSITAQFLEETSVKIIQRLFYSYYGYNRADENFEVKFCYDEPSEKWIKVLGEKEKVSVDFGKGVDFSKFAQSYKVNFDEEKNKKDSLDTVADVIEFSFELFLAIHGRRLLFGMGNEQSIISPFSDIAYIPDGRNITVSYSDTFKTFFAGNNFRLPINSKIEPGFAQDNIVSNFILHTAKIKDRISLYGGKIEAVIESDNGKFTNRFLDDFAQRILKIIKGEYMISENVETIKINKKKNILLNHASSGQRESIRIVQDLAVQCSWASPCLRTIEEPEAHLFPSAQNALTELMVMTHNRTGSHFFLTTHSPYFLSSFNNSLYAAKAAGDNFPEGETPNHEHIKQVEALGFPKHLRLQAKDFAAYQLKNGTAESIFNTDYAVTDIDGLDAVSFEIASKFEALVDIVKEAEAYEAA